MTEQDVVSPCISVCKLDKNGLCMGCFRTPKEIADWYKLSNEERLKILDALRERKGVKKRRQGKRNE